MKLGFAIPHKITIRASANMGFIVKIGCEEYVARDSVDLRIGLEEYLRDPAKWEKDYNALPGRSGTIEAGPRPEPPQPRETLTEAGATTDEAPR